MNAVFFCAAFVSLILLSADSQRIAELKCSEYRSRSMIISSVIPLTSNPTPITFRSFNCTKTVDLIVGGEDAKRGEFPHQALLGYENVDAPEEYDFKCGGSLISERYVLTAAHCMRSGKPKIVRLGKHNLADDNDNQVDFDIDETIRHPGYWFSRSYHDIALIKLTELVRFSKAIRPACLWTAFELNTTTVVATGFGKTETDGPSADILQKVQLKIMIKEECERQYPRSLKAFSKGIIDEQVCVGSDLGEGTCQGDSGGPIQVVTEPKGCTYHIVGVTSTGADCAIGKSLSIYTRVASYISWIESVVWP